MRRPLSKLLCSVAVVLLSACGADPGPADLAEVDSALRQPGAETRSVLIGFRAGGFEHRAEAASGAQIHAEWADLNAVAARLPASAIDALSRNPNVEYIEEDRVVTASGKPGGGVTGGATGIANT